MVRAPATPGRPLRFSLARVPFFLEPDYPRGEAFEETNLERLQRKWGGAREFEAQKRRHRLKERGRAAGIPHFRAERIASNTHASHRLVQWVTKRAGTQVAERLYADLNFRHFEEGKKLNDRRMLAEAAGRAGGGRAGVTEAAALAFLDSGEGEAEIALAQRVLQDLGIHSIPTTLVDGQFSIGGALPADEVEQLFRKLEAEEEEDGEPVGDAAFAKRFVFAEALGIPPGRLLEELDVLGEDSPPGGAPTAA